MWTFLETFLNKLDNAVYQNNEHLSSKIKVMLRYSYIKKNVIWMYIEVTLKSECS